MWDEPGEFPCLVSHQRPVINDLWLEGGGKQRARQPALLWDNLHPTAIFFTKHQLTRLILHYKLGLPYPLGSVCGQNQVSIRRSMETRTMNKQQCTCALLWKKIQQLLFLIFKTKHSPFTCVNIFRKPSHTARQISCCNQYEFPSFSLRLSFLIACCPCSQKLMGWR